MFSKLGSSIDRSSNDSWPEGVLFNSEVGARGRDPCRLQVLWITLEWKFQLKQVKRDAPVSYVPEAQEFSTGKTGGLQLAGC